PTALTANGDCVYFLLQQTISGAAPLAFRPGRGGTVSAQVFTLRSCGSCGGARRVVAGAYLRRIRLDQGRTLAEITRRIGCTRQYVQAIESGRAAPNLRVLRGYGLRGSSSLRTGN